MDNLITGSLQNIEHLFGKKDFEFHQADVSKFVFVPASSTTSCTLLRRLRPSTTSKSRFRPSRSARWARTTCWAWRA
jgi:hypothetical protein